MKQHKQTIVHCIFLKEIHCNTINVFLQFIATPWICIEMLENIIVVLKILGAQVNYLKMY
jgi:hypothetical protein